MFPCPSVPYVRNCNRSDSEIFGNGLVRASHLPYLDYRFFRELCLMVSFPHGKQPHFHAMRNIFIWATPFKVFQSVIRFCSVLVVRLQFSISFAGKSLKYKVMHHKFTDDTVFRKVNHRIPAIIRKGLYQFPWMGVWPTGNSSDFSKVTRFIPALVIGHTTPNFFLKLKRQLFDRILGGQVASMKAICQGPQSARERFCGPLNLITEAA